MKKFLIFFNASRNDGPADERFSTIAYAMTEEEAVEQVKNAAALSTTETMKYIEGSELVLQFKSKGRLLSKTEEKLLESLEVLNSKIKLQ